MRIFGLKACDTSRKAFKQLSNMGISAEFVDVRTDRMGPDTIERFYASFGDDLINRRSTTWRGLDDADRARSPQELLRDHPTLMKRPVIEDGDRRTLGWGPDAMSTWLGK